MRALRAELSKLLALPATWVAVAVSVLLPSGVILVNTAASGDSPSMEEAVLYDTDAGFQELGVAVIGAIILGVVAISSEYTTEGEESAASRQITTSLTAVPSRVGLLLTKLVAVGFVTLCAASAASAATFALLGVVADERPPVFDAEPAARIAGLLAYWVLTAWLAFGLTTLTRNGIVPMAVLIANTSVISLSFLLTKVTSAANYLPDLTGMTMFARGTGVDLDLAPLTGGAVMAGWVLALLTIATAVFLRRDA